MKGLFPKVIQATPQRNSKDVVGEDTGMRAIVANDIEYIENRSYKGKGKGWSLDWLWIIFLYSFLLLQGHIEVDGKK